MGERKEWEDECSAIQHCSQPLSFHLLCLAFFLSLSPDQYTDCGLLRGQEKKMKRGKKTEREREGREIKTGEIKGERPIRNF